MFGDDTDVAADAADTVDAEEYCTGTLHLRYCSQHSYQ